MDNDIICLSDSDDDSNNSSVSDSECELVISQRRPARRVVRKLEDVYELYNNPDTSTATTSSQNMSAASDNINSDVELPIGKIFFDIFGKLSDGVLTFLIGDNCVTFMKMK